jgi:putative transcriptional regulator
MSKNKLSPHAIVLEIGSRFKTARLNANLSQQSLAKEAGISLKAVKNNELGKSTLLSAISVLVALNITDQLNFFLPAQSLSPIQLLKLQGKERQRASGRTKNQQSEQGEDQW